VIGIDVARSVPAPVTGLAGSAQALATPPMEAVPSRTLQPMHYAVDAGPPQADTTRKEGKGSVESGDLKLVTDEQLEHSQDPDKSSRGSAEPVASGAAVKENAGEGEGDGDMKMEDVPTAVAGVDVESVGTDD
jgi:hypothetical protein